MVLEPGILDEIPLLPLSLLLSFAGFSVVSFFFEVVFEDDEV